MSLFRYNKLCLPLNKCFQERPWRIDNNLKWQNIYSNGHDLFPEEILSNKEYFNIWKELLNGIETTINIWNIRKNLIRLFLNPSKELVQQLLIEKKHLIKYDHTIGIQLRMGGNMSDTPELNYWGIPVSRLDDVVKQLREEIQKNKWTNNVQIYISSDSTKAIEYIRKATYNEFPVVESTLYKRGHTRGVSSIGNYTTVMKKLISDLFYMANCEKVLVSWQSLLGRMICYMMEKNQCDKVLHWGHKLKNVQIPK